MHPKALMGSGITILEITILLFVELGTGKGKFITTLAERNPHINFIGVELHAEVLISAVNKAADQRLAKYQLSCALILRN